MYLRTTAGAYAGQIRDYAFGAAQAALRAGTAERVGEVQALRAEMQAAAPTEPPARGSTVVAPNQRYFGKRHRR